MKHYCLIGKKNNEMIVVDSYRDFSISSSIKEFRRRNDIENLLKNKYKFFYVAEIRRVLDK